MFIPLPQYKREKGDFVRVAQSTEKWQTQQQFNWSETLSWMHKTTQTPRYQQFSSGLSYSEKVPFLKSVDSVVKICSISVLFTWICDHFCIGRSWHFSNKCNFLLKKSTN